MKLPILNLPAVDVSNIGYYYLLTVLRNTWFISAIWLFFWLKFMTYDKVGLLQAFAFGFGLLLEIPCGAIADILGKKRTIFLSTFATALGSFIMAFSGNLWFVFLGFLFIQAGWSLFSGSGDAFVYDSLVDHKRQKEFDKVIATNNILAICTSIIGIIAGGYLYTLNFRLPYILWGMFFALSVITTLFLTEPKTDTEHFSWVGYVKQLKEGVGQLFKPAIRPFLVVLIALRGVTYFFEMGLLKPAVAMNFGFNPQEQSYLFAAIGIFVALAVNQIPLMRNKISDLKGLYLITLAQGLGFLMASFNWQKEGVLPMLIICMAGGLSYPWMSVVINREIPSKLRATTLASTNLITKIPYVLFAVTAGNIIQAGGIDYLNIGIGTFMILSIGISGILYKMHRHGHFRNIRHRLAFASAQE